MTKYVIKRKESYVCVHNEVVSKNFSKYATTTLIEKATKFDTKEEAQKYADYLNKREMSENE